jgi:hypothetical protein
MSDAGPPLAVAPLLAEGMTNFLGAVALVVDNEPDETFADPDVRAVAWSVAGALRARAENGDTASVVER